MKTNKFKQKYLTKKNKKLSPELSYIMGVLLGDAYTNIDKRSYNICLKSKDKEFTKRFKKIINIYSNNKLSTRFSIEKNTSCKQGFHYKTLTSSKEFYFLILKLKKEIFKEIKNQTTKNKIKFLEGLYDSEGCVTNKNYSNRIIFNNRNKKIIKLVSYLLKNLNIENHQYKSMNQGEYYYELYICKKTNFIKFHKKIHFCIPRKEQRILKLINSNHS